jgi:hypothetical protein
LGMTLARYSRCGAARVPVCARQRARGELGGYSRGSGQSACLLWGRGGAARDEEEEREKKKTKQGMETECKTTLPPSTLHFSPMR